MKEPKVAADSETKSKQKKAETEPAAENNKKTSPGGGGGATGKTAASAEDSKGKDEKKAPAGASEENDAQEEKSADPKAELPEEPQVDELAAERDKYLRLAAEYDNYRKRSVKEREKTYSDARIDAITRLLPVYDNLERALKMECADEAFYKGVEMTMTQLTEILESMGVEKIPTVGEPFDPNLHNAVLAIEDPELGEKIVAEEYQKGFTLGDRVIRHSTVVVAN